MNSFKSILLIFTLATLASEFNSEISEIGKESILLRDGKPTPIRGRRGSWRWLKRQKKSNKISFTSQSNQDTWSYYNPDAWGLNYPSCNGSYQSPIYLSSRNSIATSALPPLQFTNYDVPLAGPLLLVNNGHSVNIDITPTLNGERPSIQGGILPNRYEAIDLHFHWGSANNAGSEHVIEDQRFDVEMHIVHKNINYGDVQEAALYPDGLAVLAVMIQKENTPINNSPALLAIMKKLPEIVKSGSVTKLMYKFAFDDLLGDLYTKEFYAYKGSLTTPPCAEAVTWHVFPDPIPMHIAHINKLFKLKSPSNEKLINNYRPLQDINDRELLYRIDQRESLSTSSSILGQIIR